MKLKQHRAMFTSSDRAMVRSTVEDDMATDAKKLIADDNLMKIYECAMEQGWRVEPTNNGKIMWFSPDKTQAPVPSPVKLMGRSYANIMTALERAGLDTSSLKNNKAKEKPKREVHLITSNPKATNADPLTEEEQVHADFQDELGLTLEGIAEEILQTKTGTELINTGVDVFLTETGRALMNFLQAVRPAISCDGHMDEAQKRLDEIETLYLAAEAEKETAIKSAEKLAADLSRVGKECQTLRQENVELLERANRAEQKLRAFRDIFKED